MSPTNKRPFVPGSDGIPLVCEDFARRAMQRNERAVFVCVKRGQGLIPDQQTTVAVASFPYSFCKTPAAGTERLCTDGLSGAGLNVDRNSYSIQMYPEITWAFWMGTPYEAMALVADKASSVLWIDDGALERAGDVEDSFWDFDGPAFYAKVLPSARTSSFLRWEDVRSKASLLNAPTRLIGQKWPNLLPAGLAEQPQPVTGLKLTDWSEGW